MCCELFLKLNKFNFFNATAVNATSSEDFLTKGRLTH